MRLTRSQIFSYEGHYLSTAVFLEMKPSLFCFAYLVFLGFVSPSQKGRLFNIDLIFITLFSKHRGYVVVRVLS